MSESTPEKPPGVLLPIPSHITDRQMRIAAAALGFPDVASIDTLRMSKERVIVRVIYVVQDKGIRSNQIAEVSIPVVPDGHERPAPVSRRP